MAGSRGRLALGLGAWLLLLVAAAAGWQALRAALERQARDLDLSEVLERAGLAGRVDPPRWSGSSLRWRPRPRLVLHAVETRIHSGLPGPGETSGEIRFETVELIPALRVGERVRLDRVEIAGGRVRIGRDLLPEPPREYLDPIDGARRAIPWSAFLEVARVPVPSGWSPPKPEARSARFPRRSGSTVVSARDLALGFAGYDLVPGRAFALDRAEVRIDAGQVDIRGTLRVTDADLGALFIPVSLRHEFSAWGTARWETRLGSRGSGVRVVARAGPGDSASSWTIELEDPEGRVANAVLAGRSGPLRRLRWAGPWRLEVEGNGAFPEGIRGAGITLMSGSFRLEGDGHPAAVARGTLRILPGRVDLTDFVLRSPHGEGDSAAVGLSWVQSAGGHSVSGRVAGRIDPAWLALFGEGWHASGRLDCELEFNGRGGAGAGGWSLTPRGTCRGELQRLSGPWFADTLRQGRLEAWAHSRGLGCVAVGVWGQSPFRLETRDLPLPGPDYLERLAAGSRWDLRSAECRLEDFRLSPERFPDVAAAPFWLGLPGRGSLRIETGSMGGVPFDRLRASVYRSRGRTRIDSLEVEVAGGRIRTADREAAGAGPFAPRPGAETRLRVDQVELAQLQRLLRAGGLSLPGDPRGRLSGDFRIRWPRPGERGDAGQLESSVTVAEGSLRGLPALESLARRSGLPQLEALSFRELRFELRRDFGALAWSRLHVDASPLQVEGAGRVSASVWLEAVLALRLAGGGDGDPLVQLLRSVLGGERSALYLGLRGTTEQPEVSLLTRGEYLRGLDEVRGAPRAGDPHAADPQ